MTPHRLWTWIGVMGAVVGIIDLGKRKPPEEPPMHIEPEPEPLNLNDPRDAIVAWAESQEGLSDPAPYWQQVLGQPSGPKSWCGAFAVSALQHNGVAVGHRWAIGKGLEATLPKLAKTSDPQRGDIAYFTKNQHMAIVVDVTPVSVRLVNGNGVGGRVTINERPRSEVAAFYSIEPYLSEVANA